MENLWFIIFSLTATIFFFFIARFLWSQNSKLPPSPRPLASLLLPHCSSKRFNLGNYELPENTMLFVNAWAVHRDGELWEDEDVFKPERFEGFLGDRDGFRFLPFGVGRRACPGAGFGMRTVALAVGALVQCFDWEKVDEGDIDMRPVFGVAMSKAEPLVALPKPWPDMVPILSQL